MSHSIKLKYIHDLLDYKAISTLTLRRSRLSIHDIDVLSYLILYLMRSKPHIIYTIHQVCQFTHRSCSKHWLAVKNIL